MTRMNIQIFTRPMNHIKHYDVIKWNNFVLLCVESTGHRWIPRTMDGNADMFLCCQLKQTVQQTLDWPVVRDAMTVIWRHRIVYR